MDIKLYNPQNNALLLCYFEKNNNKQKEYCLKLKNIYKEKYALKFGIFSSNNFSIEFISKGILYIIQKNFDENKEKENLNEALNKMHDLLNSDNKIIKNNYPQLICRSNPENDNQKKYFLKLIHDIKHIKPIVFDVELLDTNYSIELNINGNIHEIENSFNDNEKIAKESINKINKLLDKAKIDNNEIFLDVAPSLTCYYMSENEEQKQFCENLIKDIKDNEEDNEDIKTEIKTSPAMNFSIELNFKGKNIIEYDFDSCKNSMDETIDKIYDILGQNDEKDSILILLCFIEKGNEDIKIIA